MFKVYIAASTQKFNIGVGQYGNEQDRMQFLADRVAYWLKTQQQFEVFRNQPGWTLKQTVDHCNTLGCVIFIDNHSNAGPSSADGTEVYFHSAAGKLLAEKLYNRIAPVSPGTDQGVIVDTTIYASGFYTLSKTKPVAALVENFYHSNLAEVNDYIQHVDSYAKAQALGICDYFNLQWKEPQPDRPYSTLEMLVDDMLKDGLVTDKNYWVDVLTGKQPPKPEYLQIVFRRATQKI